VIRYGVIAASKGGKIKTTLQIMAIAWYLWPFPDPISDIGPWIMAAAVVVTTITGLDYTLRALRMRAAARA
jgi:CDP-diacylglycerol--glycerol-3-phosphate 3-phosphatidyltransferase